MAHSDQNNDEHVPERDAGTLPRYLKQQVIVRRPESSRTRGILEGTARGATWERTCICMGPWP